MCVRKLTGCVCSSTMKEHFVPNVTTLCRSGPIAYSEMIKFLGRKGLICF
jgi:hypothetical protein